MHSQTLWQSAPTPNYNTNIDKTYPYSELPYLGEYNLVKIPLSLNNLIQHVDYWGEGRIVSSEGTSGFPNCYNVNHQYKLVSSGPDRDRKIPNRIPVLTYTDCDTSTYIKDNSVATVTVSGSINTSCAKDIARIVNNDVGKVVAYGFYNNTQEFMTLAEELEKKGMFYCSSYTLPSELQGITLYKEHISFLNLKMIKEELTNSIFDGSYDNAVKMSKSMNNQQGRPAIKEIVTKFMNSKKIMNFAYKLWYGGAKDVVRNNFPAPFALLFNEEYVTIINKQYNQALKLDAHVDSYNDRLAWGDSSDKTSKNVCWKLVPVWDYNNVLFKLYNVPHDMYLKLDVNVDSLGDRQAWGSKNSNELRHKYYLEPLIKDDMIVFFMINREYEQGLKLDANVDSYGDRLLWGHNGTVHNQEERFRWIISAW